MVINDAMAESVAEDANEVLAFLLGSTPVLESMSTTSSVQLDDMPEMEPVSDSDLDPSKDESDQLRSSDTVDAVESLLEETDMPSVEQKDPAICTENPNVEVSSTAVEVESESDSIANTAEVEHEDDSAAATTDAPRQSESLEKTQLKRKKTQVNKSKSGTAMKTKVTNTRRGSAQVTTTIAPVKLISESKEKGDDSMPTTEEMLFVGSVAAVLVLYLVACVYSFFHPLVVPLPDYEDLYSAYDISNVSVHIVHPVDNSQITPQGVAFEWKLANFPKEALQLYGAEVFRYRVSLDNEVVTEEVEFLTIEEEDKEETLNRSIRFPIPIREFTRNEDDETNRLVKLHLEVTIPIPGLIEEITTFEQDVVVQKPPPPAPEDGVHLTLTSPLNDTIFAQSQPIVLEYTAVNVKNMELLLDDDVHVKKTLVEDGNLLLRGLGAGPHTFEIRALDEQGGIVDTSTVRVVIAEAA
ncbi:hypothetical protein PHMEG_00026870 [Phytophthora megakarya]|uniref:Uncharacterized protein n=1 Tax=Phytophthora megakarya TaxID=4795 RepID=A0A225V882_9STRA|nr:hypothetical protein PHMEG_00026870 [Phytophthora megakarya]